MFKTALFTCNPHTQSGVLQELSVAAVKAQFVLLFSIPPQSLCFSHEAENLWRSPALMEWEEFLVWSRATTPS